jgi:hypothetical protein
MATNYFRYVIFPLLVDGLRAEGKLADAYWDLMYIRKFGVWRIPDLDVPKIGGPDPEDYNLLLFDLIDHVSGDPEPQPNLFSKKVRLAAVKSLRERLVSAVKLADVEIKRLTN